MTRRQRFSIRSDNRHVKRDWLKIAEELKRQINVNSYENGTQPNPVKG